jgi:hypothetical protein
MGEGDLLALIRGQSGVTKWHRTTEEGHQPVLLMQHSADAGAGGVTLYDEQALEIWQLEY